jgi:hypothetical protein
MSPYDVMENYLQSREHVIISPSLRATFLTDNLPASFLNESILLVSKSINSHYHKTRFLINQSPSRPLDIR